MKAWAKFWFGLFGAFLWTRVVFASVPVEGLVYPEIRNEPRLNLSVNLYPFFYPFDIEKMVDADSLRIANLLVQTDLHLKMSVAEVLEDCDTWGLEESDSLARVVLRFLPPEMIISDGELRIGGMRFEVEFHGPASIPARVVEEAVRQKVLYDKGFLPIRRFYLELWREWARRKGYAFDSVVYEGEEEVVGVANLGEFASFREMYDSYLREFAFSASLVGAVEFVLDGGEVKRDLSRWEREILENDEFGYWGKKYGLGLDFWKVRNKFLVPWIKMGYTTGLLEDEDRVLSLLFLSQYLSGSYLGKAVDEYDFSPFARLILSLLSSGNFTYTMVAPMDRALELMVQSWYYAAGLDLADLFQMLVKAKVLKHVDEEVLALVRGLKPRPSKVMEALNRVISFLNERLVKDEPNTIALREGGWVSEGSALLFFLALDLKVDVPRDSALDFPEGGGPSSSIVPRPLSSISQLVPGFDVSKCKVQGRTLVFVDEKKGVEWRIKFAKRGEEAGRYVDLIWDAERLSYLKKRELELGLLQDLPDLVRGVRGGYLFRLEGEEAKRVKNLIDKNSGLARKLDPNFAVDEAMVFIVYKAPLGTADYLDELPPERFWPATIRCFDAVVKLARHGIIMPEVAPMIHNADRNDAYEWMRQVKWYLENEQWQSFASAGRLDRFALRSRFSNFRASGLWDFENLRLAKDKTDWIEAIGNALFAWVHIYALHLRKYHPEYFKDVDEYAPVVAEEIKRVFRFVYETLNQDRRFMQEFFDYVDFELLARQVLVFMGGDYGEMLVNRKGRGLPYSDSTKVHVFDDEFEDRGWGTIASEEIDRIAREAGLAQRDLLGTVILGGDVRGEYFVPIDVEERIDELRISKDKKRRLKEILVPFKGKWRWSGVLGEEDLGPVNGPYPITELIKTLYGFSLCTFKEWSLPASGEEMGRGGKKGLLRGKMLGESALSLLKEKGVRIDEQNWWLLMGREVEGEFVERVLSIIRVPLRQDFIDYHFGGDNFLTIYPVLYGLVGALDRFPGPALLDEIGPRFPRDGRSLGKMISRLEDLLGEVDWDESRALGPNLIVHTKDGRVYKLKFAYFPGRPPERLAREVINAEFLRKLFASTGQDLQYLPNFVTHEEGPLWCLTNPIPSMPKGGPYGYQYFIVMEIDKDDLVVYPEDLDEDEFWDSLERAIEVLSFLYQRGVYYDVLADAFHNQGQNRRYRLFSYRSPFRFTVTEERTGQGRLEDWRGAFFHSNFRKGGVADFEELVFSRGSWPEFISRVMEVAFTLTNVYMLWSERHAGEEWRLADEGNIEPLADLIGPDVKRIFEMVWNAFAPIGNRDHWNRFEKNVNWELLAKQMALFYSRAYRLYLSGRLSIAQKEIFPKGLEVILPDKLGLYYQVGTGFIHEEELTRIVGKYAGDLRKFFEEDLEVNGEVWGHMLQIKSNTLEKVRRYLKDKGVDSNEIERIVSEIEKFAFRWNIKGRSNTDDLGPLNGPFSAIYLMQVLYSFSSVLTEAWTDEWRDKIRFLNELLHGRQALGEDEGLVGYVLKGLRSGRVKVHIGIGKDWRGDDLVEWIVELLKGRKDEAVDFLLSRYRFPEEGIESTVREYVAKIPSSDRQELFLLKVLALIKRANGVMESEEDEVRLVGFLFSRLVIMGSDEDLRSLFEFDREVGLELSVELSSLDEEGAKGGITVLPF